MLSDNGVDFPLYIRIHLLSNIFRALKRKESLTAVLEAFLAVNPETLASSEDELLMSTQATQPTLQTDQKNSPDTRNRNNPVILCTHSAFFPTMIYFFKLSNSKRTIFTPKLCNEKYWSPCLLTRKRRFISLASQAVEKKAAILFLCAG